MLWAPANSKVSANVGSTRLVSSRPCASWASNATPASARSRAANQPASDLAPCTIFALPSASSAANVSRTAASCNSTIEGMTSAMPGARAIAKAIGSGSRHEAGAGKAHKAHSLALRAAASTPSTRAGSTTRR